MMAGTVTALRRATSGSPPLSEARQKLAAAIATQREATERLALLETARARAWAEAGTAEQALATARETAAQAAARAHEHNIAALMGKPAPDIPTRSQSAAALQAATDAATDAEAAARAIGDEIDQLQSGARDRWARIDDAARAVLVEETQGAAQQIIDDLGELHRKFVAGQRMLQWLIKVGIVHDVGPKAPPGVSELSNRAMQPPTSWALWNAVSSSPPIEKWEAAIKALRSDAAAPLPTL